MRGLNNVSFLGAEATELPQDSFDVIYCHFVLHDISPNDLAIVIPQLAKSLKPGGIFVIREPLNEAETLRGIKRLTEHSGLLLKTSRITHVSLMGNAVESIYAKNTARGV